MVTFNSCMPKTFHIALLKILCLPFDFDNELQQ